MTHWGKQESSPARRSERVAAVGLGDDEGCGNLGLLGQSERKHHVECRDANPTVVMMWTEEHGRWQNARRSASAAGGFLTEIQRTRWHSRDGDLGP